MSIGMGYVLLCYWESACKAQCKIGIFTKNLKHIGIGPSHKILLHSLLQRTADIHASLVFFDVTPQVNTNYSARTNLLTLNDILGVGIYWCM